MNILNINVDNPLDMSFGAIMKLTLFDMWFTGDVDVMGYWMMNIIFVGTFLSVIVSVILINCKNKVGMYILLLLITVLASLISTYYLATIIGVYIAYKYVFNGLGSNKRIFSKKANITITIIVLFVSAILAGYPSSGQTYEGVYFLFSFLPNIIKNSPQIFHILGASIFLYTVIYNLKLQTLFAKKGFRFLGEISYSVYLIHPLVISFISMPVYNYLNTSINVLPSVIITIILSMLLVIAFSYLFYVFIEKYCNKFINWGMKKLFSKSL